MEKLRRKFGSCSQLNKFLDKHGVVGAARKLGVDRRTLYSFRLEIGAL